METHVPVLHNALTIVLAFSFFGRNPTCLQDTRQRSRRPEICRSALLCISIIVGCCYNASSVVGSL
ncbi:uncharacterized protein V1518DRAFT_422773 [Limtongia smithiae]|uniref:uncharacterized protein n=1 Tax=Limtongia smithiae TaxID=1125753 RepID=UPI0034CD3B88